MNYIVTDPTLDTKRLREMADAVEQLPYHAFEMGTWLYIPNPLPSFTPNWDDRMMTALDAGVIACLAGWGCIILDEEWSPYGYEHRPNLRMQHMLGLTPAQSSELFAPRLGISVMCSYTDITPANAAATLRHLADTGSVSWHAATPKEWKSFIKRSPEHWERDILETDAYCDVAGVFYAAHHTEVNSPQDGREMPDEVREFLHHVETTWERIA